VAQRASSGLEKETTQPHFGQGGWLLGLNHCAMAAAAEPRDSAAEEGEVSVRDLWSLETNDKTGI